MASVLFDGVAAALEAHTTFNRLQARGTLRLALKQGGLVPDAATAVEIEVVIRKLVPGELRNRGILDVEPFCEAMIERSRALAGEGPERGARPEDVFGRFGA